MCRFYAPQLIPLECKVKVYLELIKPLLLHIGGSTAEELACLQRDAAVEVLSDDFRTNWQLLDV